VSRLLSPSSAHPQPPSRRGERGQPVEAKPEVEATALETPDIIGPEEAEEAGAETAIEEDEEEEIVNLGDDAAEIPADDDDNAFLEEEGEADVSGIVRTPGEES
jgi:hypothetical protein